LTSNKIVEAHHLGYRRYYRPSVFQELSFSLEKGKIIWIQGPNGAGKSTLLKILSGVTPHYQGKLKIASPVCYLGHEQGIPSFFSVKEILQYYKKIYGCFLPQRDLFVLEKWGLTDYYKRPFHCLSEGQKRKVSLARIDFSSASLWLLDEPYEHLDENSKIIFFNTASQHCKAGGSAFITHHGPIPAALQEFSTVLSL